MPASKFPVVPAAKYQSALALDAHGPTARSVDVDAVLDDDIGRERLDHDTAGRPELRAQTACPERRPSGRSARPRRSRRRDRR